MKPPGHARRNASMSASRIGAWAPQKSAQVQLNPLEIRDLLDMYRSVPVIKVARKAFLSKVLPEPFSFSIPALKMENTPEMTRIIESYWMPWLRKVYDWCKLIGVCPYYLKPIKNSDDHQMPVTPDFSLGHVSIEVQDNHEIKYKWYWNHGTQVNEEKNMLWIVTEDAPDGHGIIRSPLASLLPTYRSLLKLRNAQDVASTQAARPVHVIEYTPNMKTAVDDGLVRLTADFDKAAGIGKARRDRMNQQQLRVKQAELFRQMQEMDHVNRQKSTVQPTMWTDTPDDILEEMDAGFSNRVVQLGEHYKYGQAAKPQLVADYNKFESQFNMMAAAIMDFALELLTPTGSSRAQNVKGAEQYENERIREQSTFFETILQPALVLAYRKRFQSIMDQAHQWRLSRLGGDPSKVIYLYPELDVSVDLSNTTVTNDEDMRVFWKEDAIISKETYAKHVLRNKNIPLEAMHLTQWPDGVPRELLVKGGGGEKKGTTTPPKKRPRTTSDEGKKGEEKKKKDKDSDDEKKKKKKTKTQKKTTGEGDVDEAVSKKD